MSVIGLIDVPTKREMVEHARQDIRYLSAWETTRRIYPDVPDVGDPAAVGLWAVANVSQLPGCVHRDLIGPWSAVIAARDDTGRRS